jgi:predicted ATPase
MKILSFKFQDQALEWKLEETSFNKLTLLVGASGVGKTQILKAVHALKEIAEGNSLNGVEWSVVFEVEKGQIFSWTGAFETQKITIFEEEEEAVKRNQSNLIHERISLNGKVIAERKKEKIFFLDKATIKLSPQESLMSLLKEEDAIKEASIALKKIHFSDQSDSLKEPFKIRLFNANKLARKYDSLKKIQEADEDIRVKLFLIYRNDKKVFNLIKDRFRDIFPQIEDIKVAPLDIEDEDVPSIFKDYPFIQIKEAGVKKWVGQERISSGMFRTLIHVSELYLCSEGTVFLIDEFENSLGINCINEITDDILKSRRQLQFILTSHHPYIINNIHFNNWKVVTRNAGVVKTHTGAEYNLGASKHDAFMQLLQLEEYQTGAEQL